MTYEEMIAMMLQQSQGLPDYTTSGGGQYLPPELSWQQGSLNYKQDMFSDNGMGNPFMAYLAGGGAYDPAVLQGTYEVDQPAVTEGMDMLNNVMTMSPGTPQAAIAQLILEGKSPEQAIAELDDVIPKDAEGLPMKSIVDFAQSSWQKVLGDKPEVGREIPSEFVNAFTSQGFTDPRQEFTPEFVDPNYGMYDQATADAKATWERMMGKGGAATAAPASYFANNQQGTPGTPAPSVAAADPNEDAMLRFVKQKLGPAVFGGIDLSGPIAKAQAAKDKGHQSAGGVGVGSGGGGGRSAASRGGQQAGPAMPASGGGRRPTGPRPPVVQARKDYQGARDGGWVAKAQAQAAALDAAAAYGTPTLMQMAQRMGVIVG